jgi:hypothetical protein
MDLPPCHSSRFSHQKCARNEQFMIAAFSKIENAIVNRTQRSHIRYAGPCFMIPKGIEGWAFTSYLFYAPKTKYGRAIFDLRSKFANWYNCTFDRKPHASVLQLAYRADSCVPKGQWHTLFRVVPYIPSTFVIKKRSLQIGIINYIKKTKKTKKKLERGESNIFHLLFFLYLHLNKIGERDRKRRGNKEGDEENIPLIYISNSSPSCNKLELCDVWE